MSDWQAESAARKVEIDATLARLGLTVESVFVPFSASRNKAEKHKTLNWRVTLKRNGRDVLTTNYSAGIAHCPGHEATPPAGYRGRDRRNHNGALYPGTSSAYRRASAAETVADFREFLCAAECESGVAMQYDSAWGAADFKPAKPAKHIKPEPRDAIYSLVMDCDVLDAGGFENWAGDLGFDPDSRKAESIYRLCLELALAMRAALGDSGMAELRNAFQDY